MDMLMCLTLEPDQLDHDNLLIDTPHRTSANSFVRDFVYGHINGLEGPCVCYVDYSYELVPLIQGMIV